MDLRFQQGAPWQVPGGGGEVWRIDERLAPGVAGVPAPPRQAGDGLARWARRLWLARGVGPVRQRRLEARGFRDLVSLQRHPVWGEEARRAWEALRERRVEQLRRRRASDAELVSLFGAAEVLFFDVETLGLAPVFPAFLAGFLRAEGGGWRVTLLLARSPAEEPALLDGIEAVAREAGALVTYNGRRFDLPFLAMRRAVSGRPAPPGWPGPPVLDLLADARRRFGGVLADARLETVDRYLRWEDGGQALPASLVPEYYRRFVESGDPGWIEPVLQHNVRDLVAVANLWAVLAEAAGEPARDRP
ncbi:MAG TPA: ribonuclease H-like domain-containing protein [Limnochordales bacterium]